MTNLIVDIEEEVEARIVRIANRPIPFEAFLDLNVNSDMELVNGVMVKKMAAQLEHEKLLAWLFTLINAFVRHKKLGMALQSRTTVRIDEYRARLPDLLFIQHESLEKAQQRAVYGAPDLVVELVSPNDRPSDIIALETDYRSIGVPEIVFIDQQKRQVRILRKQEAEYDETELTDGRLYLDTIAGFTLQVEWLFDEPRPDEFDLLIALLNA